jgi:replicative DNA helicase
MDVKIPPQAKEIEQAVLGAILLEKDAFERASVMLKPEMFYVDAHQLIFRAMAGLSSVNQPIDTLTVAEQLRACNDLEKIGSTYYLTTLTNSVVSSTNIEAHSRIISQKFILREAIKLGSELMQLGYNPAADPFEVIDFAEQSISGLSDSMAFGEMTSMATVLVNTLKRVQERRVQAEKGNALSGVPTGIRKLDEATLGWQNGDLIYLAARPSVGKTAFALNLIRSAARHFQAIGGSVAIWSLEMESVMLAMRMLSAESDVYLTSLLTGRVDEDTFKNKVYKKGVQGLANLPIFFDDSPGLTMQKLKSKSRKLKRSQKLGLIVVDYLQLMTGEQRGNREQEIARISRELKLLAKELQVPIIALSQLSRDVEKRSGDGKQKKPQLSDLRESGSLEQDADVVMFLWAPSEEEINEDAGLLNRRFLRISKQRNGTLATIDLDFRDEVQHFSGAESLPQISGNWKPVTID